MKNFPQKLQDWIEARKRFHLSHAHVQMARELGMNPKKFGALANHCQEPWKAPKALRDNLDYPEPIVAHALARERFLATAKGHLGRGTS